MKSLVTKWLILELIGAVILVAVLGWSGAFESKEPPENPQMAMAEPMFAAEFESIFDGKTLNGWEGDKDFWSVQDGMIVGEIKEGVSLEANTFLIFKQPVKDFELKVEFRISEKGNSGIQYRSDRVEGVPFGLRGYQADIDGNNTYTGQNYEERKRTTLAYRGQKTRISSQPNDVAEIRDYVENNAWKGLNLESELGDRAELGAQIKKQDWNEMHLIIRGTTLQHYVNGILMSEVLDLDTKNQSLEGLLGFQVHRGPPMKVEFREVRLRRF